MDPSVQVLNPTIEVCLVVLPSQPINPGRRISLESKECGPKHWNTEMVEKRGEPLLPPLPCDLSYALQRLGHACPVLCPARALLTRVPLGPGPWLHQLRCQLSGIVRRLPCCRVGGGALDCSRAGLRPPLKLGVQFSRTQLSRRRSSLGGVGRDHQPGLQTRARWRADWVAMRPQPSSRAGWKNLRAQGALCRSPASISEVGVLEYRAHAFAKLFRLRTLSMNE